MKNNTWLCIAGIIIALFVLNKGGFLMSVLDQPSFTYSSFMYPTEQPLTGDVMITKHDARVGPLVLSENNIVSIGEPAFVCDTSQYLKTHSMNPPNSFSDECFEYSITFEDQHFTMKNGDEKQINPLLKIKFHSSGTVTWEDFKCVYEDKYVKYAEPLSCSFGTLSPPTFNKWIGNIDFYVNTKNGLTMNLSEPKINVELGTANSGQATVSQNIFKKINGGLRIIHTQEGLFTTPLTMMQDSKTGLSTGKNVLVFNKPTNKLGVVSSEVAPYITIKTPHLEWTGIGGSVLTQETTVKNAEFFQGMTGEQEEFRTTRTVPVENSGGSLLEKVGNSFWKNIILLITIFLVITIIWYAVLKK